MKQNILGIFVKTTNRNAEILLGCQTLVWTLAYTHAVTARNKVG
jgi:hypothetical protein